MGTLHVYFPSAARWNALAPEWVRPQWSRYEKACRTWCAQNRIQISLTDDAHFQQEK